MYKYLKYRCKKHPKNKLSGDGKWGKFCSCCCKTIYSRWCTKCKEWAGIMGPHKHCPRCDSPPKRHELRNYDMMWHDGDVYCLDCETRVRTYDAG